MKRTHLIAGAASVAVLAGGAGAIAATSDDKAAEKTVLTDAAKTLGVSADDLRSALSKAEDAQVDAAVKAGTITQAQADEIKKHRADEGTVLGLGHRGGPGGRGFGGPGGGPAVFDAVAKALGIKTDELFTQLRKGKTLTEIAKANGKTLDDVKTALKPTLGDHVDEFLDHFGKGGGPFGGHGRDGHFGPPPAGAPKPPATPKAP